MAGGSTQQVLEETVQTIATLLASLDGKAEAVQARVLRDALADVLGALDGVD